MHVGVGYGDDSDTAVAGILAAKQALARAGRSGPCDLVLLFATAHHDPKLLRDVVSSVLGETARIVGGGAVGTLTNDAFGYAGDQVGLAAVWFDTVRCDIVAKGGIVGHEEDVGTRLGRGLAAMGARPDTPALLFYDAIDRTRGDVRLNLATPLLAGLERGLGFLPASLVGAGLQGDFACSETRQWVGRDVVSQYAMALAFSDGLRIDSAILHGCRPGSDYFTVTRAEGQTILEIDGQPAIPFLDAHLQSTLPPEEWPFFMIFGVNHGDPAGPYHEKEYANRLCLAIDRERDGIVMFESDMVAGTRFQIMYRSLDLEYIQPKVDGLFAELGGRRPVFAFYINCAGRAAKYGGEDLEDVLVVQHSLAGRAPMLGIYSGVEIAPLLGRPSTLDWTGVFCLFSVPS